MAPVGPSPTLLTLVDEFLSSHGLASTSKALNKELAKKNQTILSSAQANSITKDVSLEQMFVQWLSDQKTKEAVNEEATSASETSSDSDDSEDLQSLSSDGDASDTSESSSSSESSDEEEDSAASVESEAESMPEIELKQKKSNGKAGGMSAQTAKLKRKFDKVSSNSSTSSSDASDASSEDEPPTKKPKTKSKMITNGMSKSRSPSIESVSPSAVSSSASSSETSSEEDEPEAKITQSAAKKAKAVARPASPLSDNSSATVVDDGEPRPASQLQNELSSAVEDSSLVANIHPSRLSTFIQQKKHVGAKSTPLAQMSAESDPDGHISNQYQAYDYAERAYKDLSITRGKGFTKEKNKKKRGSYRGGAIDVGPGRGFKFDN